MMVGKNTETPTRGELRSARIEQENLKRWFVQRGVRPKRAAEFVRKIRCMDTADAALYLRFELAPLHLANADNVNADMKRLFGCGPKVAKRIIRDLNVYST